jgi:hypothetical protein
MKKNLHRKNATMIPVKIKIVRSKGSDAFHVLGCQANFTCWLLVFSRLCGTLVMNQQLIVRRILWTYEIHLLVKPASYARTCLSGKHQQMVKTSALLYISQGGVPPL